MRRVKQEKQKEALQQDNQRVEVKQQAHFWQNVMHCISMGNVDSGTIVEKIRTSETTKKKGKDQFILKGN